MSNKYTEGVEEAAKVARAALPLAGEFSVPVNPVNYAVLYEYVGGKNSPLNKAVDSLRESGEDLTDAHMYSLYHDYISGIDEQALRDARMALATIVGSTQVSLGKVSRESQVYGESLGAAANQLSADGESLDVANIVTHLVDETKRMQATSRVLQNELQKTNQDLSTLRTEFERVREESMIDPLTGVQNRRAFDASLAKACDHAKTGNEALCLLMVDVDHFKKVNDNYGHVVGDAVLKRVSALIGDTVRGGDVLARYGGEEFVVLLPDTPMEGAEKVADNICMRVRNLKMNRECVGEDIGRVTVSVGVALFSIRESSEVFVVNADAALYRAKESGRNRVCTHEPE